METEGSEKQGKKIMDLVNQSCYNFQNIYMICNTIKCFLVEQNRFSHLKVTSKKAIAAFRLPLGVDTSTGIKSPHSRYLLHVSS